MMEKASVTRTGVTMRSFGRRGRGREEWWPQRTKVSASEIKLKQAQRSLPCFVTVTTVPRIEKIPTRSCSSFMTSSTAQSTNRIQPIRFSRKVGIAGESGDLLCKYCLSRKALGGRGPGYSKA